jgi:hypothetical protein
MVKVLQFGMTGNLGGMETYLLTQYRQLDRSLIRYDFVKIDKDIPLVFADEIIQNGDKLYQVITRKSNPLLHYWQVFSLLYVHRHEYKAVVKYLSFILCFSFSCGYVSWHTNAHYTFT